LFKKYQIAASSQIGIESNRHRRCTEKKGREKSSKLKKERKRERKKEERCQREGERWRDNSIQRQLSIYSGILTISSF